MFDIKKEISEVIKVEDFIVLPDFGAFVINYSKPFFDVNNNIVNSVKSIGFNQYVVRDFDEKLFNRLNKNTGLSLEFLKQEYFNFLNEYRVEVDKYKKFDWLSIGIFFKNKTNEIEFYPEKSTEYIPEIFQNSIEDHTTESYEETKTLVQEINLGSSKSDSFVDKVKYFLKSKTETKQFVLASEIKVEQPLIILEEKTISPSIFDTRLQYLNEPETIEKPPFNYIRAILYALPMILLLSGLFWTIFLKKDKKKVVRNSIFVVVDSLDLQKQQEFTDSVNTIDLNRIRVHKNENERKNVEDLIVKEKRKKTFYVSVGAFKDKEKADNLVNVLLENGIPIKMKKQGTLFKVYLNAINQEQYQEFSNRIEQLTGEKPVLVE